MSYYWHNNNKCNKDDVLLRRQHIMSIQLAVLAHDDDSKNKQQQQQHDDVQQTVSFDCPQLLQEWTTPLGDDVCSANIPSPPSIADNKPPLPHFSRKKMRGLRPGDRHSLKRKCGRPTNCPPQQVRRAAHGKAVRGGPSSGPTTGKGFFHWHWSLLPLGSSSSLHTEGSLQGRPARFQ